MEKWKITIPNFNGGFAPGWWYSDYPSYGNVNMAGKMQNCDITDPAFLTQGPGLAALENGTDAGAVSTLIKGISIIPSSANLGFAVGGNKLYEITATAVSVNASNPVLPHTIDKGAVTEEDGEDVCYFQGTLYYSYNHSGNHGDVGKYDLTRDNDNDFDDDWLSTIPTGKFTLTNNPHPMISAGNGFMYIADGRNVASWDGAIAVSADLDLPLNSVIVDLEWAQNKLWIAVNRPNLTGLNKNISSIYVWDGEADSWEDEIQVLGKIGALYVKNGILFVFYQDISFTGGYKLGYINGLTIVDLCHFKGALPSYYQVSDYQDLLLWIGSDAIYAWGSGGKDIPVKSFQLADGGYSTVGGLGNLFGTPFVASNQSTSYKICKFSGYDTNSNWKSLMFQVGKGKIDKMIVYCDTLGTNARADFTIKYDRGRGTNTAGLNLTETSINRKEFMIGQKIDNDFRVEVSFANGSASNPVKINRIEIYGERYD